MPTRPYGQSCSVARSLEILGERWTLLIVRDAFLGTARFDGFLGSLQVPRNVLSERLNTLVAHDVFVRTQYQDRPPRYEYRLTAKGRALAPVLIALMQWGDEHLDRHGPPPRTAEHVGCGGYTEVTMVCHECGGTVAPTEVVTPPREPRAAR